MTTGRCCVVSATARRSSATWTAGPGGSGSTWPRKSCSAGWTPTRPGPGRTSRPSRTTARPAPVPPGRPTTGAFRPPRPRGRPASDAPTDADADDHGEKRFAEPRGTKEDPGPQSPGRPAVHPAGPGADPLDLRGRLVRLR